MTHSITISGKTFEVEPRYAEGHTLNANEAAALNQTFYENLRNNFAGKAKEGADQAAFNEYASTYQFGIRVGGSGSRDPVEVEAMNLARDAVRKGITAAGKKISDYSAKAISEAASRLVAQKPQYRELAKERVEQMKSAASDTLDKDMFAALEAANAEEAKSEENPAPVESNEATEVSAEESTSRRRGR